MNIIEKLNERGIAHAIIKAEETLPYPRTDTVVIISAKDKSKVDGLGFKNPELAKYKYPILERELTFEEARSVDYTDYNIVGVFNDGIIYEQKGKPLKSNLVRDKYFKKVFYKTTVNTIVKRIKNEYFNGGTNEIEVFANGLYIIITYEEDTILKEYATRYIPASYERGVEVTNLRVYTADDDELVLTDKEKDELIKEINKHFEPLPMDAEDFADIFGN
jgi:hypothetical protein